MSSGISRLYALSTFLRLVARLLSTRLADAWIAKKLPTFKIHREHSVVLVVGLCCGSRLSNLINSRLRIGVGPASTLHQSTAMMVSPTCATEDLLCPVWLTQMKLMILGLACQVRFRVLAVAFIWVTTSTMTTRATTTIASMVLA